MKFKLMATTFAFLSTLFSWSKAPVVDGKLSMSEDETEKLKAKVGEKTAKEIVDAINAEITQIAKNEQNDEALQKANDELEKVKAEVQAMLDADTNLSAEEKEGIVTAGEGESGAALTAKLKLLPRSKKKQDKLIAKLLDDPEGDSPLEVIKNAKNMKHSATHLFATGHKWDAFEKRPWNQRLRDNGMKATDFNDSGSVPLLQDDLEHFVRENPQALESMFNDFEDLPKEWSRRTGVLDRVANGVIIPDEIVQGRKKGWAPKNKFKIAAEEGRVFRKKIDITFNGYELQEIENTWIRSYNKEGSHPWKMSFIGFLLGELVKQQKLDDRRAQINGIFVQTPEGDGLCRCSCKLSGWSSLPMALLQGCREKIPSIRSSLGEPTKANIVDYIKEMIRVDS